MVDPSDLIDALVEKLRAIEDLVELVGGDPDRIFAYSDRFPDSVSIDKARYKLPSPGMMIAYEGCGPGSSGTNEAWKHELSVSLRAKDETGSESPAAYYAMFRQFVKGKPAGEDLPMNYLTVHESFLPMDTPTLRRMTDAAGVDYFEIAVTFTEIGDD
jgi:hypothetical protein